MNQEKSEFFDSVPLEIPVSLPNAPPSPVPSVKASARSIPIPANSTKPAMPSSSSSSAIASPPGPSIFALGEATTAADDVSPMLQAGAIADKIELGMRKFVSSTKNTLGFPSASPAVIKGTENHHMKELEQSVADLDQLRSFIQRYAAMVRRLTQGLQAVSDVHLQLGQLLKETGFREGTIGCAGLLIVTDVESAFIISLNDG